MVSNKFALKLFRHEKLPNALAKLETIRVHNPIVTYLFFSRSL